MDVSAWIVAAIYFAVSAIGVVLLSWRALQIRALQRETDALRSELTARTDVLGHTQALIDNLTDGVITMDCHGCIESFNPSAARMFGYSEEEVVGSAYDVLTQSEAVQYGEATDSAIPAAVQALCAQEATGLRKDGSAFPMEVAVSTIQTTDGPLLLAIVRDVTDQKTLQAQLLQAQKLESIGQLAAGIAHEINTPIQFVGDNATFLREVFTDIERTLDECVQMAASSNFDAFEAAAADVREVFEEVDLDFLRSEIPKAIEQSLDGVERVATIVRAMKEFSHPPSHEKTPSDLNKAIESTITVARNEWKYVADIAIDLDPELPLVPCLIEEVNQVTLNLIVNAAHAIADALGDQFDQKGTIRVSTRRIGKWAEIRISDSGTGIPEAIRARVFDPFFTSKPVGKGTGQGLAIARSVVVDKHGGTITFETETGKGTTWIVRLPLEERENS